MLARASVFVPESCLATGVAAASIRILHCNQAFSSLLPDGVEVEATIESISDLKLKEAVFRVVATALSDFQLRAHNNVVGDRTCTCTLFMQQGEGFFGTLEVASCDLQQRNVIADLNASIVALMSDGITEAPNSDEAYQNALTRIATEASRVLEVARVGIWWLDAKAESITCDRLVEKGQLNSQMQGKVLRATDVPAFFEALTKERTISVVNALTDKKTMEFVEAYLVPNNIGALLDHPIRAKGRMVGLFCCEHVGGARAWTDEEILAAGNYCDLVGRLVELKEFQHLREQEQMNAAIREASIENAVQLIGLVDTEGVLLHANGTALAMIGAKLDDVVGKKFWECPWWDHHAELAERLKAAVEQAAKGEHISFEALHPDPAGNEHWVEFSLVPVRGPDGKVKYLVPSGHDITERRLVGQRIAEERERLQQLLSSTPDAVTCVDYDPPIPSNLPIENQFLKLYEGAFTVCNQAGADYYEVGSPAEVLGRRPVDIGRVLDVQAFKDKAFMHWVNKLLREDCIIEREEAKCLHGETHYFSCSSFLVRDEEGNISRMWGVRRDTTNMHSVKLDLERQHNTVAEAERLANICSLSFHRVTLKTVFSEALMERLGINDGEHNIDTIIALVHDNDRPRLEFTIHEVVERVESRRQCRVRLRVESGAYHWFEITITLAAVNSLFLGRETVLVTLQDIHKQYSVEQAYQSVLDAVSRVSSGDRFIESLVFSLGEATGYKYIYVGRCVGEDGDSIETLKVWKDGKLAPNLIYKLATTPCKNVMERGVCQYDRSVREKFPDDKLLQEMRVESYLGTSLLDSRGRAIGILVALDDKPLANADLTITLMNLFADRAAAEIERMDREQELLQLNEQLECRVAERTRELEEATRLAQQANAAKSEFLSSMSHEIRTPLNGILGNIELLSFSQLNDQQQRWIATVRECSTSLLNIINDILDLSKVEAGKLEVEKLDVDLLRLVEAVADMLSAQAHSKGISLSAWVDPNIPRRLTGDPTRIRQLLFNLIGNAIKFTDSGSVVVRLDVFEERENQLLVKIHVEDTGIGIAEEDLTRLFQPFMQADVSTQRRFGGTGLGLAICRRLAERMDGSIEVASKIGEGTTFTITLPMDVPERRLTQRIDQPLLKKRTILVLAENTTTGEYLKRYLEAAGAQATVMLIDQLDLEPREIDELEADVVVYPLSAASSQTFPVREWATQRGCKFLCYCEHRVSQELGTKRFTNPNEVLVAPVRRESLTRAVVSLFEAPNPDGEREVPTIVPLNDNDLALASSGPILVAEDNPINRDLLAMQLELLGLTADFAEDGKQALELASSRDYALILSDCHMPVVDGFAFTRDFRELEAQRGAKRTPVLAFTASAMDSDIQRCFRSGMDDYIAKPVNLEHLKQALAKWLIGNVDGKNQPLPGPTSRIEDGDPIRFMIRNMGLPKSAAHRLLSSFFQLLPGEIEDLRDHQAKKDRDATRHFAHRLKSTTRMLGATALGQTLEDLEHAARSGSNERVEGLTERSLEGLSDLLKEANAKGWANETQADS